MGTPSYRAGWCGSIGLEIGGGAIRASVDLEVQTVRGGRPVGLSPLCWVPLCGERQDLVVHSTARARGSRGDQKRMATNWKLVRLNKEHAVDTFTCGTRPGAAEIDRYLRESALAEQAGRLAAVWIVEDTAAEEREGQIVGFFTLSPVSVKLSPKLLEAVQVDAPYAAIGGWLLGRMGLAERLQGQDIGKYLVAAAVQAARALRDDSAGVILAVDPKNESLMDWYLKLEFGFQRIAPNDPRVLRLVMKL